MECYYHPDCTNQTKYIIIYGCLNQHIWDRPLCNAHASTWLSIQKSVNPHHCGWPTCQLNLDQYELIRSDQVDYRQLYWYKARYDRTPIIEHL